MPRSDPAILHLTRLVLRVLVFLNLLMGVLIFALLVASLVAERQVLLALGADPALAAAMRIIMLVGIAGIPLTHILLTRLLAIVDTVGAGDPFVAENAARLQTIAWALLWLELLHLVGGAVAALAGEGTVKIDIGWNFSLSGWLAVLLLFVLARVFDHGARMREDLEGTI